MRNLTCALAAGMLTLSVSGAVAGTEGCDPGEMVIKFSHIVNTDKHPKGIAATLLVNRVNAEMDGTACMEVYPNATLYNDDQVLEAMLQGDVQLAAPSLSKFESFTKQFRIFDLPFMFKNMEAVDAFQASDTGQDMKEGMVRRGLLGLEFWHNGMKQITANTPLVMPEDVAGLKMRVQPAEVIIEQMRALNANPQPLAFPEVYGALQTGVVDGQQNTWSNIYGQKFFEVQDGATETNHLLLDYMVVTSVDWWESLDADVRDQFATILHEVTVARNGESERVNQEAKEAILAAGGVVRTLTPEQRQAWVEAMKPVWSMFEADVGADNIAAAQEINARY
ncbi:DctP family TRAP transporter solute-binding subunit [Celeribacter baekdonensis]|uniref:C4-dicarboxylate ABC transporter n=1 Tax=Celeribacter baekdonensis TaxID=875171 RepID=A0A2R4M062_9RHOB|nr:DctP family TRAP transporter solute-binding subunit [Celeribacter baekdonensis]AVW90563.1 C4-dicarboxylate ABC transporter [Celeribacter baekdonensis]|tara:strand:- start:80822 stop:81832 length:1011 start_codon:yes stop_codon:yes gene_type:complete